MQSDELKDLATALSKAQAAIVGAKKDSTNPHYKASYADMASVREACHQPLADNGLSIIQMSKYDGGEMRLVTRIMHSSGQWIEDDGVPLLLIKKDMQGLGSALTYARRYGLMAALGIAPEDDDGEAASKGGGKAKPIEGGNVEPRWTGPLNKTALAKAMRDFAMTLGQTSDEEILVQLLDSHAPIFDQCMKDLPSWWYGDGGENKGASKRIEEKRDEIAMDDAARGAAR